VLDVGSGNGAHILELNSIGINAIGIDPFLTKDFIKNHALIVKKGLLTDLNDKFDLIGSHIIEIDYETNKLLKKKVPRNNNQIVKITINSNNTVTLQNLFTLTTGRSIAGDIMYTTNGKIILTTQSSSASYITQYVFNGTSWVIEVDKQVSPTSVTPFGLATIDNNLYIFNGIPVFKINTVSPYTLTEVVNAVGYNVAGASQVPSCCNVTFTPQS
jgi:hypothetical protein